MIGLIASVLGIVGQGIGGFFGVKTKQAETINNALSIVGDVAKTDDARAVAAAQIISAEANSEAGITRTWRPIVVLTLTGILVAHLLGFTAVNVTEPVLMRIFDLVEYSVLGYMGMRSADKWIRDLSLGSILKQYIGKTLR
jgi:hypothetical protein